MKRTRAFFGAAPAAESYRELERWASRALKLDERNGEALALPGGVEFVDRERRALMEYLNLL